MSRIERYHEFLEALNRRIQALASDDSKLRAFLQGEESWPHLWIKVLPHVSGTRVAIGFHCEPYYDCGGRSPIKILTIEIWMNQFRGAAPGALGGPPLSNFSECRNAFYTAIELNPNGESPEEALRRRKSELIGRCIDNLCAIHDLLA